MLAEAALYDAAFDASDVSHAVLLTDWCVPVYTPEFTLRAVSAMVRPWVMWSGAPKAELQKVMDRALAPAWIDAARDPPTATEVDEHNRVVLATRKGLPHREQNHDENHDEAHVVRRLCRRNADWLAARVEARPVTLSVFAHHESPRAVELDLRRFDLTLLTDARVLFVRKVSDPVPASMPLPGAPLTATMHVYPDNFACASLGGRRLSGPSAPWSSRGGGTVLMPCTEAAALAIARDPSSLRSAGWRLLTCNPVVVEALGDKRLFHELAARCGVTDALPVHYADANAAVYPCVCKTRCGAYGQGVSIVRTHSEILQCGGADAVVLQELVRGPVEFCASLLVVDGVIRRVSRTAYTYEADEYIWPRVGERRTKRRHRSTLDPSERQVFERLLRDFSGLCNVNFKYAADGKMRILEVNPRLGADLVYDAPFKVRDAMLSMVETMAS